MSFADRLRLDEVVNDRMVRNIDKDWNACVKQELNINDSASTVDHG